MESEQSIVEEQGLLARTLSVLTGSFFSPAFTGTPDGMCVFLGLHWPNTASFLLFILPFLHSVSTAILISPLSLQQCPPSFQHIVKMYFKSQAYKLFVDFILNRLLPDDNKEAP